MSDKQDTGLTLEIGAGPDGASKGHSWGGPTVTLDANPDHRPDICSQAHMISKGDERYDAYFDNILASHVLEHVKRNMVLPTLKEWYRVLKPGGSLYIYVPDLMWCAREIVAGRFTPFVQAALYGGQMDSFSFHKVGFTFKALRAALEHTGFSIVAREYAGAIKIVLDETSEIVPDLEIVAHKPGEEEVQ